MPNSVLSKPRQENCKVVISGVAHATQCVNDRAARAVTLREKQALPFLCKSRLLDGRQA
jgi:hypothetical protein